MQRTVPNSAAGLVRVPLLRSTMVVQPVEASSIRKKVPPGLNDRCPCTPSLYGRLVRTSQYGLLAGGSALPLASSLMFSVSRASSPAFGATLAISHSETSCFHLQRRQRIQQR